MSNNADSEGDRDESGGRRDWRRLEILGVKSQLPQTRGWGFRHMQGRDSMTTQVTSAGAGKEIGASGAQVPRTEREIRDLNSAFVATGIRLEGKAGAVSR